jgi:hypothetical protein
MIKIIEFSGVRIVKHTSKVQVDCPYYSKECSWGQHISNRMNVASMREFDSPRSVMVWGAGFSWATNEIFDEAQQVCTRCVAQQKQRVRG